MRLRSEEAVNWSMLPAAYISIGVVLDLVRMASSGLHYWVHGTGLWEFSPFFYLFDIFGWPRYVYILLTQGVDPCLNALMIAWLV